jgi:phosphatidylinositol alpha-mannosyltransferase
VIRRVALVSPYALSVYGGVQEQVLAMSRELCSRGLDVVVVAPDSADRTDYDTPATVRRFGTRLSLPANGSRAPLTLSMRASTSARDAVVAFKPDVVHFHEPFAPLLGWSTLRRHATPGVATFHRNGSGPALSLTAPLLRRLARGLDVASAVSEAAAATIRRVTPIEVTVLFNGFETERFVATPRERASEVVAVCVGRLEERKGVSVAIDAVRTHNARHGDQWRLVVIGDGPERARLEARAGHDELIVFAGAVADDVKRAWLRRANVLIAPALRGESFGLTLLEGMASETRVVASDISGYREAAASHAVLFAPGDATDLERALVTAIRRDELGAVAAAREYAEHWSMRRLVDAYQTLYDEAVRRFNSSG